MRSNSPYIDVESSSGGVETPPAQIPGYDVLILLGFALFATVLVLRRNHKSNN
jgi:hypothetical protein